jgi:hypothetical protein
MTTPSSLKDPMMRALLAVLLIAIACSASAPVAAQQRKLPLVDEAAGDATWQRFKKRLLVAVDRRDKQFLLSILDKNVRNQDERSRGVATFRKQWELDTDDSPLWHELATALQLGAAHIVRDKRKELCAPYLLGTWPDDVEPFHHGVVIARDAAVQAEPSTASAALGPLSYDIVPVLNWEVDDKADARQKWVRIRYREREGYVPEEQIRSPIEQAACFVKSGSSWRMTGFAPAGGE